MDFQECPDLKAKKDIKERRAMRGIEENQVRTFNLSSSCLSEKYILNQDLFRNLNFLFVENPRNDSIINLLSKRNCV